MAENTQNITAQLAEAEQRVQQLRAQLAEAGGAGKGAPAQPTMKGQPATLRMAADMGQRGASGQDFVAQDRREQEAMGNRARIQAELRKRLLQFAMPGATPMQIDMARRGAQPPPVSAARGAALGDAQAPSQDDWNNPWRYDGG